MASKKLSLNHYAQPKERKYFQHHRAGLALTAASIAIISIGIGMALTGAIKSWLYQDTISETSLIEQKYQAKFNQLNETRIDATATSTRSMQYIVKTVAAVERRYLRDPEELLALISNDVSIFPDIRVTKINWFVSNYSNSTGIQDVNWVKPKRPPRNSRNKDKNAPKPKNGFFEIAEVEGEFLNFDGNYRYVLSAVDDLEKTMVESGKYYSVQITKRPLNIESDNRLSGDAGPVKKSRKLVAQLGFRVVREVPKSE